MKRHFLIGIFWLIITLTSMHWLLCHYRKLDAAQMPILLKPLRYKIADQKADAVICRSIRFNSTTLGCFFPCSLLQNVKSQVHDVL
jgi:hypothetical protein